MQLYSRVWRGFTLAASVAALVALVEPRVATQQPTGALVVRTVSTHADRVSGDDVLVEILEGRIAVIPPEVHSVDLA